VRQFLPALLAALLALPAVAGGGADGGETPQKTKTKPEKLYWHLPRRLPGGNSPSRYGTLPFDIIAVKKWLCVSAFSAGDGQALFWARSPEGTWIDTGGSSGSRRMSRWVRLGDRAAALTGGRTGIHLAVISPEAGAEKRYETHDVLVQSEGNAAASRRRQYYDVYALDLAVHEGKLCAASNMGAYVSGNRKYQVAFMSSSDGGKTWSKPKFLAESTNRYSAGGQCLALWSDGKKLHMVYRSPQASGGTNSKPRHQTSIDGGKTWQDAPALPVPASGSTIQSLRTVRGGKQVYLLASNSASGGRVYLYRSSDGGEKWAAPQAVGKVKAASSSSGALDGCHLAIGAGKLALGYGGLTRKSNYDRKTRRHTYSTSAIGGLLVSRDAGKTWKAENFTRGLKGRVYAPLPAIRADGGIDLAFGWTDGKGSLGLLYREARSAPPAGQDERLKAAMATLIKNLAAADYKVRERAASGIKQLGMVALPALRAASRDRDAERSLNAEDLLGKMTPAWWKGP
jgi:BNR repeat-like domain